LKFDYTFTRPKNLNFHFPHVSKQTKNLEQICAPALFNEDGKLQRQSIFHYSWNTDTGKEMNNKQYSKYFPIISTLSVSKDKTLWILILVALAGVQLTSILKCIFCNKRVFYPQLKI